MVMISKIVKNMEVFILHLLRSKLVRIALHHLFKDCVPIIGMFLHQVNGKKWLSLFIAAILVLSNMMPSYVRAEDEGQPQEAAGGVKAEAGEEQQHPPEPVRQQMKNERRKIAVQRGRQRNTGQADRHYPER